MHEISLDPEEFQKSITNEIYILRNRVRNLIGGTHWGEEGRYKEVVLRNVIRRFLPNNLSIGTGFVVRKDDKSSYVSNQLDIIVYDNTIPALFSEGDFSITTYKNVKGIIEVKTKVENSDLRRILQKAEKNGKLIGKEIFNGICYEYSGNIESSIIDQALKELEGYVNHISLGPHFFIKFWSSMNRNRLDSSINCRKWFL